MSHTKSSCIVRLWSPFFPKNRVMKHYGCSHLLQALGRKGMTWEFHVSPPCPEAVSFPCSLRKKLSPCHGGGSQGNWDTHSLLLVLL